MIKKILCYAGTAVLLVLAFVFLLGTIADEKHLLFGVLTILCIAAAFWLSRQAAGRSKKPQDLAAEWPVDLNPRPMETSEEQASPEAELKEPEKDTAEECLTKAVKRSADSPDIYDKLQNRFISLDFETTGFSRTKDRIVQIGAVLYEGGKASSRYSTLVNPGMHIPGSASRVNKITDEIVSDAPTEEEILPQLLVFLGDAAEGETVICAYNADFDLGFLTALCDRRGIRALFTYVDVLAAARQYIPGLSDYKQPTVAAAIGVSNTNAHRADADAETCGSILTYLLPAVSSAVAAKRIDYMKKQPTDEEREVCAHVVSLLEESGRDTDLLKFERQTNGIINIKYPYRLAAFRLSKTKPMYFLIDKADVSAPLDLPTEDDSTGRWKVSVPSLQDIVHLQGALAAGYDRMAGQINNFYRHNRWIEEDAERSFTIKKGELTALIEASYARQEARTREKAEEAAKAAEAARIKEEKQLAREQRKAEKGQSEQAPRKKRRIAQYNDGMELIREFDGIDEASAALETSEKNIRDAANGRQKHAAGYIWRFLDD